MTRPLSPRPRPGSLSWLTTAALLAAACSEAPLGAPAGPAADAPHTLDAGPGSGSGAQLDPQRFLITPTAFDFGQVPIGTTSPAQAATVTNLGPGAVSPQVAGGGAGVFGGATNCQGATLAEGESCTITYRFTPTEGGVAMGSTTGSISGQAFAFEFRGEGLVSPRYSITPTTLDFGQVAVGTTSPEQEVTVTNLGPGPVTPQMAGGAAGVFGGATNCQGATLAEGESCRIVYRFTPTEAGDASRSTSGSIDGQAFAFEFRGEGLAPPRYRITPTAFDFGEVEVGVTSPEQEVTVTNLGPGPVSPQMAGGAAGVFGGATNCQGATLQEGESCRIVYRFAPTEPGDASRSTSGSVNGQPFAIDFSGIGLGPDDAPTLRYLISPVGLDFGEIAVGTTSDPQDVTVTNLGPGPVTPQMAGGAAGVFGGAQNCQGTTLQEGESCRITYRFTPTDPGDASRSTSGSINGQPFAIDFHGVGVQRDRYLITPAGFDFGEVEVGATSPSQEVTVTNLGPGPVTPQMAGGAAGVFGGSTDCQGATLQEGESCRIAYRFAPTEPGDASRSTSGSINGQSFAFDFRGIGVHRDRYLITPTGFDFGQVLLGTSSAPQDVLVTNLGPGPATPQVAGGAAGQFDGATNCQGATLQEGESCRFTYRFTPVQLGAATASTAGSVDGQSFAFTFRGVGIGLAIGEFLPPAERPGRIPAGSTLPVRLRVTDITGAPIEDDLADALAAACAVTVTFSGSQGDAVCAGYVSGTQSFRANVTIPGDAAPGDYQIVAEVRLGGVLVATASVQIAIS